MQLSINENLTFSDISSKIWDWVSNIIIGHGQDGNLSNGSVLSSDSTGSLVDGGEIGIEITWIRSSSWDFFSGGGDFSEGIRVGRHISQDDQDVQFSLVSQILSSGKSKTWGNNSFDGWVLSQVKEKNDSLHGSVLFEIGSEESGDFHVDSHSSEDDGEVLIRVIKNVLTLNQGCLSDDLGTDLVVWETVGGEKWNFLSSGNRVHGIDGGDTCLDHFLGVFSAVWVNGLTIDVQELLSQHWGTLVDGDSGTVERSSQHFFGDWHLQGFTSELTMSIKVINS